ncbi:hypothetical protein EV356DRAFT_578594 [Viridothelium virens]|uniref:DUF6590 domain-containing protein n=1 Tax=Viridothelium virens TaxID=1048519 RepID=A0A6A6H2T7_VIRVR|nr:hypothetical protein EV356DRAFT_578594 [Viridothelium virens]
MADGGSGWSDWCRYPNTNRYYRYRRTSQGGYEYYYWPGGAAEQSSTANYSQQPQTQATVSPALRRDSVIGGPSNQASSSQGQSPFNLYSLGQGLPSASVNSRYYASPRAAAYTPQGNTNDDDDDDDDDEEDDEEDGEEDEDEEEEEEEDDEEVQQDSRPPRTVLRPIHGSDSGSPVERLDPRFRRVRNRDQARFFTIGRVFQMLWTEPASQPNNPNAPRTRGSTHFSVVQYGERAFSEIRRFIVVQPGERHSLCVPIQTYGNRGVTNRGSDAVHHAIAYTQGQTPPILLPGERITKYPIPIVPDTVVSELANLGERSRINFSKTYTIEHNVKVCGTGKVSRNYEHLLGTYWRNATMGFSDPGHQCATCLAMGRNSLVRMGERCRFCGT